MLQRITIALFFGAASSAGAFVGSKTPSVLQDIRGGQSTKRQSTKLHAGLEQFAPAATSLFANMLAPASILAGAMVPIGFASGLDFSVDEKESKLATLLRKLFPFACTAALSSQLCSIMWASVAINKLTETEIATAASVWDLIQRDFALPWAGVNAHFVMGMLSFMWVIGTKAFFMANKGTSGLSAAGFSMSAFFLMTSIVNRGVARGGGEPGQSFGKTVLGLTWQYCMMLIQRTSWKAINPLQWTAVVTLLFSLFGTTRFIWQEVQNA